MLPVNSDKPFLEWRQPERCSIAEKDLRSGIVLGFGIAALFAWVLVLVAWNLEVLFNYVPQLPVDLYQVPNDRIFSESQSHSLAAAITKRDESLVLTLNDGASFVLPRDEGRLKKFMEERASNLEFLGMLGMQNTPGAASAQLWPSKSVQFNEIRQVINLLASFGYDNFDLAVEPVAMGGH